VAAGVHVLPVPTPFAVGRVNCYLVDDDPLTLVDCGPNSGTSLVALEAALAEHGRRVEDLERIVLTHQHPDHIGLAPILAARSGAELCALDALVPWLADYSASMEADDRFALEVMTAHGVPEDVRYALRAVAALSRAWGAGAQVTSPLADGGRLAFAGRTWEILHRPGHSPSDTVFLDAERDELVGGDHVIGHISSNPLIARPLGHGGDPSGLVSAGDRPQALRIYLDSLARTREMGVGRILPGHGEPVTEAAALIDERVRMHQRRADKLLALIAERRRTAYELAHAMWGKVAITQAYLTLSEVLGHTDLLLADGRAREERDEDGVVRFAAT
jgi:glyoxylase-like metal-dependent hydrolase (beta-lactamase superfamily II)